MSDVHAWQPRAALSGIAKPGRYGTMAAQGVRIERREGLALAIVIPAKGRDADVRKTLSDFAGAQAPAKSGMVRGKETELVWSGPGQWLVVSNQRDAVTQLTMKLADLAAVTDQSDGRALMRLSGPRVRDLLAKGCPIDLHPRAFNAGDVALTTISHIGVHLWQVDDAPTYDLALMRSMAESFWSWLDASAAEFGYSAA